MGLFSLQYYLQSLFLFLCTYYLFCNIDHARTVNNYQFFDRHMFLLYSYKVFYVLTTISSSVGLFSLQYYLQSLFLFLCTYYLFCNIDHARTVNNYQFFDRHMFLLSSYKVFYVLTTISSSVGLFSLQYYLQSLFLFLCTYYLFCNIDHASTVNNYQFFDRHMFLLSSYKVFYVLTTISSSVGLFSLQYYLQSLFLFLCTYYLFCNIDHARTVNNYQFFDRHMFLLSSYKVFYVLTTISSSVGLFSLQYYLQSLFLFLCTYYLFCNIDHARTVNNYQFFDRHMFLLSSYKVFYVLTTISSSVGLFSLQYYLQSLLLFLCTYYLFCNIDHASTVNKYQFLGRHFFLLSSAKIFNVFMLFYLSVKSINCLRTFNNDKLFCCSIFSALLYPEFVFVLFTNYLFCNFDLARTVNKYQFFYKQIFPTIPLQGILCLYDTAFEL